MALVVIIIECLVFLFNEELYMRSLVLILDVILILPGECSHFQYFLCRILLVLLADTSRQICRTEQHNSSMCLTFIHLKPKLRLLYLKTQFVPRSKHFSSRL